MSPGEDRLRQRLDAIEEAYEFMLAYAAQGLSGDEEGGPSAEIRKQLSRAESALEGLVDLLRQAVQTRRLEAAARYRSFIDVVEQDVQRSRAAIQLVLAQRPISSQLVDNLNALIHLRALLTDLFLIDEVFKSQRTSEAK